MDTFVFTVDEVLVDRRNTCWHYNPVFEAPAMPIFDIKHLGNVECLPVKMEGKSNETKRTQSKQNENKRNETKQKSKL